MCFSTNHFNSQQDNSEAAVSYRCHDAGAQTEPPCNSGQDDNERIKRMISEVFDTAFRIDSSISDPFTQLAASDELAERRREMRRTLDPPSVSLAELPPLSIKMESARSYLLNVFGLSFLGADQDELVAYAVATNEPSYVSENWTGIYKDLRQKAFKFVEERMPTMYPDANKKKNQLKVKFVAQLAGLDGKVAPIFKAADFDTWAATFLASSLDRNNLAQYPRVFCYVYSRTVEKIARVYVEKKHGVCFGDTEHPETTDEAPGPRSSSEENVEQDGIPIIQATRTLPDGTIARDD